LLYFITSHWTIIKDFASILQSIGVVVGLLVGGYWTYRLFIQNRQKYPRANLTHKIFHTKLHENKIFLRVKIIISNIGNVLICFNSGFTRISQISPVCNDVVNSINDFQKKIEHEIEWSMIDKKEIDAKKEKCEIEPGESDEIYFDFLIDSDVEIVNIYSYFANIKKKSICGSLFKKERPIGWQITTIYNLKEASNV
jgi:hypothetical protein